MPSLSFNVFGDFDCIPDPEKLGSSSYLILASGRN
jgi:hypothetical protein